MNVTAKIVRSLVVLMVSAATATAQPATDIAVDWETAPTVASSGSTQANIQLLDFKLGMTLSDVEAVLRQNAQYQSRGFGDGQPITIYERNVSGYYSKARFPKFDHMMKIEVDSDGTKSDLLYLFFLPDPKNRRLYAMNRRVLTDNRTIGRDNFWNAVSERLGPPNMYRGRQSGGGLSVVNIADYSWDLDGNRSDNPGCKWDVPLSEQGGVAFVVNFYNLTDLDFLTGWHSKGCSTVAVVAEAGYSGTEAINSYSMVAYAIDIYKNSSQTNNAMMEGVFSKLREELSTYKSGAGKGSPDL